MFHSCQFDFKKPVLSKKGVGGRNIYSAIASTGAVDRHREILVPRGVITESFMKNPVMLNIHNSREYPVGKVVDIKVSKEAVEIQFEFSDDEEGSHLEKLYTTGFMNAFSVGFIPKNYIDLWDMRDDNGKLTVTSLEVELPDGDRELIDLSACKEVPYGIISKWELLEVSPVSVPANPEALMIRAKDDIVRKYLDAGHSKVAAKFLDSQLQDHVSQIKKHLDELLNDSKSEESIELSNAVPYQAAKTLETAWDSSEARACLAQWASVDGTGEKETLDWTQFAKGFGWLDLEKADQFLSYKFVHHTVKDSELGVVWAGLTEAMAGLLSDIDIKDAVGVYEHLKSHYEDFGKVAPEFKTHTEDELKAICSGVETVQEPSDPSKVEAKEEPSELPILDSMKSFMQAEFLGTNQKIAELEETVRLRMNILGKMFDELQKELAKEKSPVVVEPEAPTDEAKLFAENLNVLSSMFDGIRVQ